MATIAGVILPIVSTGFLISVLNDHEISDSVVLCPWEEESSGKLQALPEASELVSVKEPSSILISLLAQAEISPS